MDQWRGADRLLSRAESLFCRGSLPTWWRSSSAGPAGLKAQLTEGSMASSGELSTYLFILKHVSDSHRLFDDV